MSTIDKIQKVISDIFILLQSKEDEYPEDMGSYKYYTHVEIDSDGTDFEQLSNANLIGIKTNLPLKYANVLLCLFQMIIDNNYYLMESKEEFKSILEGSNIDLAENDELVLFNYKNSNLWLKYLRKIASQETSVTDFVPKIDYTYAPNFQIFQRIFLTVDKMSVRMKIVHKLEV